jgi:TubC N-terminal docking domain
MSAVPLIEAVQRAGGAITLRGDRLRLSAPEPLPQNLLEELRAHKAEVINHLQQVRRPKLAQPATDTLTCCTLPSVETASWIAGVARLTTMPPPHSYPAHAWRQLNLDAERFLDDWAAQAAAFGWPGWELFGCHRRAPWGRIQGMGLVLLLHGDPLAALTANEAVIRRPSGAHQTRRRKAADPLPAAERCLVWELGDDR